MEHKTDKATGLGDAPVEVSPIDKLVRSPLNQQFAQHCESEAHGVKLTSQGMFASADANVLTGAINEILPKLGQEFYRHSGDLAIHLRVALDQAGFKIVRKPVKRG